LPTVLTFWGVNHFVDQYLFTMLILMKSKSCQKVWVINAHILCGIGFLQIVLPGPVQLFSPQETSYKHQSNLGCRCCTKISKGSFGIFLMSWFQNCLLVQCLQPELHWYLLAVSCKLWNCICLTEASDSPSISSCCG